MRLLLFFLLVAALGLPSAQAAVPQDRVELFVSRNVAVVGEHDSIPITFRSSQPGRAVRRVYHSAGEGIRTLFDGEIQADSDGDGTGNLETDGEETVASGVSLIRLEAPAAAKTARVVARSKSFQNLDTTSAA